ncbi:MAG: STAS domain-containing protein [Spirochaetes bacterium]|nr:STAS domain-containing protein [Spirochaetota bacterium]
MNLQSKVIDNIVIIYPRGRLDFTLSMAFEKALGQIMNENKERHFVINMRDIDYINSSTLRVIAVLAQNLQKRNLKLVTCDTRGIVRRVFEITNVLDLIEVAGSEEDAVAILKGP